MTKDNKKIFMDYLKQTDSELTVTDKQHEKKFFDFFKRHKISFEKGKDNAENK